jgi:hypothetical protein
LFFFENTIFLEGVISKRALFDKIIKKKGAPSSESMNASKAQTQSEGYWCHRPANLETTHVGLFYAEFGWFLESWHTCPIVKSECESVSELVQEMGNYVL